MRIVELLTPARPGLWAGVLTFRPLERKAADVAASLSRGRRVFVRDLAWPDIEDGALRASLHMYNTHDEVDKLVQGLQQALR